VTIHGWLYDMEHGNILAYDPETGAWQGLLETAGAARNPALGS
jgi:hypothetical protein